MESGQINRAGTPLDGGGMLSEGWDVAGGIMGGRGGQTTAASPTTAWRGT